MKHIRTLTICLFVFLIGAISVFAGDTPYPNQDTQKTFAQKFFDAKAQGDRARQGFVNDVFQHGSEADKEMWRNLDNGLTPDGSKKLSNSQKQKLMEEYAAQKNKPSGFMGDPKDPGPQDWSDTLIETDGKGNVTGFKPKDWYDRDTDGDGEVSAEEQRVHDSKEQVKNMDTDGDGNASLDEIRAAEKEMDTDGDGKVSDEERKKWNDKESHKRKNGPGSPGNVPPIADWDKDGDGEPDKGFKRSCWQCCPGQKKLDECHYGWPGNCDNGGSCDISEICHQANEVHDDVLYECHICEYMNDWPDPCIQYGLYSSASCNSACSPIDACYAVYIDQTDGSRRTSTVMKTDLICYECGSSLQPPPKCEDGLLDGVCVGDDCAMYEICRTVGDYCHVCEKPPIECKDGYTEGKCSDTSCQSNQKCVQTGKCYICVDKPEVEEECEHGYDKGACPADCDEDQECIDDDHGCHICEDKESEECSSDSDCDDGLFCNGEETCDDGECVDGESPCSENEICDEDKDKCLGETEEECEHGYAPGACPGTCDSETEVCTPDDHGCHICDDKPEEETCEDAGVLAGSCPGTCDTTKEVCSPIDLNSGLKCHACDPKNMINFCEDEGYLAGACPQCLPGYICHDHSVGGDACHSCEKDSCYYSQRQPGGCPGTCTNPDTECEATTIEGKECHWCKAKTTLPCPEGTIAGDCLFNGGCPQDTKCRDRSTEGADCHVCQPMTGLQEEPCPGAHVGMCPGNCTSEQDCDDYMSTGPFETMCHTCSDKEEGGFQPKCPQGTQPGVCIPGMADPCKPNGACTPRPTEFIDCYSCRPITGDSGGGDYISVPGGGEVTGICPDQGKPGGCRGTCTSGQLCINRRGPCHICMDVKRIEITWVIIIVETPYGRFVLGKNDMDEFEPSSVMALAKVDPETGKIQNSSGEWKKLTDMMGGFNSGMGIMGMATTGSLSMPQLADVLGKSLEERGSFGGDCFGDVVNEADQQAEQAGTPTSEDILGESRERKKDKERKKSENFTEEQVRKADESGDPAISGPIVSCGMEGRDKVLRVYDGFGRLVDTITKDMFQANPAIITEKLGIAQEGTDLAMKIGGVDIAGYVEKFTGLPIKKMQSYSSMVSEYKAKLDQAAKLAENVKKKKKKKKKKRKGGEEQFVFPNDPYYKAPGVKKKKKLLGILGGSGPKVALGGAKMKMGASSISERKADQVDVKDQWGLHEIGFTDFTDPNSAWNVIDANQKNVTVAVIDSGLDFDHPDGPEYIWTNTKEIPDNGIDDDNNGFIDDIHGWNFLTETHDFTDIRGHGSFVAGIIAAKTNNGIGIAGINPGAVIMPLVVADEEGETNSFAIYRAINYAVSHGAKVINISLGARSISKMEQVAITRAHEMGAVVVIAAGNSNDYLMEFGPSSSKGALAVGQIDYAGNRSTVSNWGPNLGLVAPGEQIFSLVSKDNKHVKPSLRKIGYYKQNGTSFSTPMVAATASLILAKDPTLTNTKVVDRILTTATDMDEEGWDGMTGYGLLNASEALRATAGEGVTVMFNNIRINTDTRDKPVSIDIYGTLRGGIKEYYIEAGKGTRARKFKKVAGPLTGEIDFKLLSRVNIHEHMRGSDDWILRIRAVGNDGKEYIASTLFELND